VNISVLRAKLYDGAVDLREIEEEVQEEVGMALLSL
jgi:hypothetical protein